jgi:hypothetical protein
MSMRKVVFIGLVGALLAACGGIDRSNRADVADAGDGFSGTDSGADVGGVIPDSGSPIDLVVDVESVDDVGPDQAADLPLNPQGLDGGIDVASIALPWTAVCRSAKLARNCVGISACVWAAIRPIAVLAARPAPQASTTRPAGA